MYTAGHYPISSPWHGYFSRAAAIDKKLFSACVSRLGVAFRVLTSGLGTSCSRTAQTQHHKHSHGEIFILHFHLIIVTSPPHTNSALLSTFRKEKRVKKKKGLASSIIKGISFFPSYWHCFTVNAEHGEHANITTATTTRTKKPPPCVLRESRHHALHHGFHGNSATRFHSAFPICPIAD